MLRCILVILFCLDITYGVDDKVEEKGNDLLGELEGETRRAAAAEEARSLAEALVGHRCVPTAVARGPCHACVCSDRGVYFCRPEPCSLEERDSPGLSDNVECDANMLYNEGSLWCNCNARGRWRSANCRDNFRFVRSKKALRALPPLPPAAPCQRGEAYASDCNVCDCNTGVLSHASCTNRTCVAGAKADKCKLGQVLRLPKEMCACSETGEYVDKLCIHLTSDASIQRLSKQNLAALTYGGKNNVFTGEKCVPETVIRKDCNTCRCTSTGQMICTNKLCISSIGPEPELLRSSKKKKKLKSKLDELPRLASPTAACEPGRKYRYKCNTCTCTSQGAPSCTTMYCLDDYKKILRSDEIKAKKRRPGRASLPAIKRGQKCEPGRAYRLDCNVCRCTPAASLVCTKMLCIHGELPWKKGLLARSSKKVKKDKEKKKKKKKFKRSKQKEDKKKYLRQDKKPRYQELPQSKKCVPGEVYSKGCQRCFCNDHKIPQCTNRPCNEMKGPVKVPRDIAPKILPKEFEKLPELPHEAAKCVPGRAYRITCNRCLCLANGNLLCNNLLCLAVGEVNRIAASKASGKPCDETTMLEVNPEEDCMTCACKRRQTSCAAVEGCTPYRLRRRHLHGQLAPLLQPAEALEEDASSCVPGMVYRQSCNNCYCQEDGSLRCTRKGCLNYQQVQALKAQRERLLKDQPTTTQGPVFNKQK